MAGPPLIRVPAVCVYANNINNYKCMYYNVERGVPLFTRPLEPLVWSIEARLSGLAQDEALNSTSLEQQSLLLCSSYHFYLQDIRTRVDTVATIFMPVDVIGSRCY